MFLAPAPRGRCIAQGTSAQSSQSRASCIRANELGTKIVSVSGCVWGSPFAISDGAAVGGGDAGARRRDVRAAGRGGGLACSADDWRRRVVVLVVGRSLQ